MVLYSEGHYKGKTGEEEEGGTHDDFRDIGVQTFITHRAANKYPYQ